MSKLEELYTSIETLKKLGVKINKEQLKALDDFEEDLIKTEVLPSISQDIAPRLNPIKRDLVLVVEYHPGQPISVALSRKAKISDISDAKSLTPVVSEPVSGGKVETKPDIESTRKVENHTKGLKVTFPDGRVVCEPQAINTLITTIKAIGYEKVAQVGLMHKGYNLVSKKRRPPEPGKTFQHYVDGWYIYSLTNNMQKKEELKAISDFYHLNLKIEEGKPEK